MKKLILLSFLTLLGCATESNYHDQLNMWVGRSKAVLIMEWGTPSYRYKLNQNIELLEYDKKRVFLGDDFECKTTFILKNNVVDSWKTEGNDCTSY
ncbi:MAG: hypothetical protein II942_04460 [Alphaproteobacteria bacterium]|nr:hypothetical protein [Alphaproteobacteria bacterium]